MNAGGGSHRLVLLSLHQSNLSKTRNGSQMVENFSNELIPKNQSLSIFPERKLGRVISLPWINNRLQRQRSLHGSGKMRSGLGAEEDRLEAPFSTCRISLSRICWAKSRTRKWERVYLLPYCQIDLVQAWLEVMKPVDNSELNLLTSAGNTTRLL